MAYPAQINLTPDQILARYGQGETIAQIAQGIGVSFQAVYKLLLSKAEGAWKEHQTAQALFEYEKAKKELNEASNKVEVARASALVRTAQWELERLCRRIYGQDSLPAGAAQVAIQINLKRSAEQQSTAAIDVHAQDIKAVIDESST